MHDSLDLPALKTQIDHMKAQTQRDARWIHYIWIFLAISICLSFIFAFLYNTFRLQDRSLAQINVIILCLLLVIHTFYLSYVAWRKVRDYSKRINIYAPSFVHRPTALNIIWEFRGLIAVWTIVLLILIGHEQFFESPQVLILLFICVAIVALLPSRLMVWAYKGGLPRVDAALKILPLSHRLLYQRAVYLYQKQQFAEAETIMRKLLATRTDFANPNVVLELLILSECLTHQERFDEVLPVLEAAIKISPIASLNYVGLVEWYLDHESDAERAVELMDIALANTSAKQHVIYGAEHAISAYASALTGRTIRAKASIATALGTVDQMSATSASEVNRRVGYAYRALGETETARKNFNRAIELDPNGLYGDLARQALESLMAHS